MTQITADRIQELLEKSRLAEPQQLTEAFGVIRSKHAGELPSDPVAVCKELEDLGVITRWQSEKVLQGKYKGFFLGKHKLLGHLGSGGMSSVYLAEHVVMKHKRAIKVLPKSKLGNNSYLERFRREAEAIAALNHPNIVRAYDIDNEKDTHYIVMEYVEGADMQTLVKKHGPLPYEAAADYIAQSARGLHHAHQSGLVHRDVKPANLLVNKSGVVKILDLGLALFSEETDASLTMEYNDKVLGTADYLAPEQAINSHKVDHRADMYGLGCTLYFLLTGHPPFPEGSIASRIIKHQNEMPQDIRKDRPDCPGELEGVCVKMMQKDPKYRYADCTQVAEVLEAWLEKFRKENPNRPVFAVMDVLSNKTKFSRDVDTVSNRTEGTMGGKTGRSSGIVKLSASDSGVLRAIAKSDASTIDSKIDLVHDSNSPNRSKSKSQAIARAESPLNKTGAASKSDSPLNKPLAAAAAKPNDKSAPVKAKNEPNPTQTSAAASTPNRPSKTSAPSNSNWPVLIGVGVAALALAGIVIAFLVSRG
ncbi:MAG: serine/threonine protein kinase [Pirellula sp.]|jgi:serine/threonine-protein kinase|nr:serine/threonine protein kinase [Pirellula sp.]